MKTLMKMLLLVLVALPNLSWAGVPGEGEISKQLVWLNNELENHDHETEAMNFVFKKIQASLNSLDSKIVYEQPGDLLDMDIYAMSDDVSAAFAGLDLEPAIALEVYRNIWHARQQLKLNRIEQFDVPWVSEDPILTADFVDNQLWNLEDLLGRAPAQFLKK